MFYIYPWKACPFLNIKRKGVDGGVKNKESGEILGSDEGGKTVVRKENK